MSKSRNIADLLDTNGDVKAEHLDNSLTEVSQDTTPVLGGNLDTSTFTVDGRDVSVDGTKLDGIEAGATADQAWGDITGTLANQTDLQTALNGKQATLGADDITATHIAAAAVGASELNVTGNGTSGQALLSDGDGTMSWGAAGGTTVGQAFVNSGQSVQVAVPSDATHAIIWGCGGGGAGGNDQGASNGAGGNAGYIVGATQAVTGGQNIAVYAGNGGNSTADWTGNAGQASTFQGAGLTVSAGGGTAGGNGPGSGGTVSGITPGVSGTSGNQGTGSQQGPQNAVFGNYGKGAKQGVGGGCAWLVFIKD